MLEIFWYVKETSVTKKPKDVRAMFEEFGKV